MRIKGNPIKCMGCVGHAKEDKVEVEIELTPEELTKQLADGNIQILLEKYCLQCEGTLPKPDKIGELEFHYTKPSPMEMVDSNLLLNNITTQQIYQLKDKLNELIRKVNERC